MKYLLLVFLFFWLTLAGVPEHSSQKPVRVIPGMTPQKPASDSELGLLFYASELVVFGTVTAERPADRNVGSAEAPLIIVETAYELDITETFRFIDSNSRRLKSVSLVVYSVGDRDRGDYIERHANPTVNPLGVGQQYVLFLRRRSGDATWSLTSESGRAVIGIRGSSVAPQASSPLAMKIAKESWLDLRTDLRRLGKVR